MEAEGIATFAEGTFLVAMAMLLHYFFTSAWGACKMGFMIRHDNKPCYPDGHPKTYNALPF